MNATISDRVQQRLRAAGMTQSALGAKIGLDPTKLSKSLRGTRTFSTGELAAIGEALSVDIHWLISGAPSSLSPRFGFRHTFDEDSGAHEKPSEAMREQIENVVLAYHQAGFTADVRLDRFREKVGTDSFDAENLPTEYPQIRPAMTAVQQLWQDWLASGNDPVEGVEDFLTDHFGIDLVVADVAGAHRVNAQALQIAGAHVIVVERSGAWYSTLFGIFHELAHLLFGAVSWMGQHSGAGEAAFEKFANGFAGDVVLSRDDVRSSELSALPLPDLAEFLWDHGAGLHTARIRCSQNKVEGPPEHIRQGDITLLWRNVHGDVRSNVWSAPSYPARLVDRHEQLVRAGDAPPDVLAWMLGVPVAEIAVDRTTVSLDEGTQELLDQLGIPS